MTRAASPIAAEPALTPVAPEPEPWVLDPAPTAVAQAPARRPYTVADTPEVVARIDADLARVLAVVRDGDPGLRSLVLTGGFARGEGAVLGGRPQNDYDFVALRGLRRPRIAYEAMAQRLERELGLHIDLAPVAAVRLPVVSPTIFWYETALRGRVLWGEDLLGRISIRSAGDLDPAEGLRLLANRAAGLLLITAKDRHDLAGAHAYRIQASKGILAAVDATLLAARRFAPSQSERWQNLARLRASARTPEPLRDLEPWLDWAFRFKVDPEAAPPRDALAAWKAARGAILATVPLALRHAGLPDLDAYARRDRFVDRAAYALRSRHVASAHRLVLHPAAQVRAATLRLLEDSQDGHVTRAAAEARLATLVRHAPEPLRSLEALRRATMQ